MAYPLDLLDFLPAVTPFQNALDGARGVDYSPSPHGELWSESVSGLNEAFVCFPPRGHLTIRKSCVFYGDITYED